MIKRNVKNFILLSLFLATAFLWPQCLNAEVVSHHPRIWLTPEYVEVLRNRASMRTEQYNRFIGGYHGAKKIVDDYFKYGRGYSESVVPLSLAYQTTGNQDYAKVAIAAMMGPFEEELSLGRSFSKTKYLAEAMIQTSIGFDWLYDKLNQKQKDLIVKGVNQYADILMKDYLEAPWHGHAIRNMAAIGMWGYASYGENDRAGEFIEHARSQRFNKLLGGMNDLFGDGGGLPGGSFYGLGYVILQYVEAVYTATGENLYVSSHWFKDRLKWWLLFDYPGVFYDSNRSGYSGVYYDGTYGNPEKIPYAGYFAYEDGHRGRSNRVDVTRMEKLILIQHFKDDPMAKQLFQRLTRPPLNKMNNPETYKTWPEFLWFDPKLDTQEPEPLSHYAPGMGTVTMRSGWTYDATWIFFKCGDIFSTSHQHWDQNSFSIFRKGDLAIKSGLYDGDGVADHVVNYYSRTIGANSILVYDPKERFVSWRGVHYPKLLNDGGQKAYRIKPEFSDVNDWKKHSDLNDTGDITQYEDRADFTYIRGDATNAYNNPRHCAPSTVLGRMFVKNKPKISFFTREFVFLRPDYIVVFDRVNSTNSSYQKKWLLHFLNKPLISGHKAVKAGDKLNGGMVYNYADTITASAGKGKLFVKSLLPEDRRIRLVGGRDDQDYWVFGRNAKPYEKMSRWQKDYGEWRIEIEPAIPRKDDIFLNVLYPCDIENKDFPDSTLIMSNDKAMLGACIAGKEDLSNWIILFSKNKNGDINKVSYRVDNPAFVKHMLCNMKPDVEYEIRQNGHLLEIKQASGQGILYFESEKSVNSTFQVKEHGTS